MPRCPYCRRALPLPRLPHGGLARCGYCGGRLRLAAAGERRSGKRVAVPRTLAGLLLVADGVLVMSAALAALALSPAVYALGSVMAGPGAWSPAFVLELWWEIGRVLPRGALPGALGVALAGLALLGLGRALSRTQRVEAAPRAVLAV